ncbi:hypothetical protein WP50_36610, partial [Lactiplantibacillus plantarum]
FTHKKNHLTLADAKRMQASGNIDFQSHTVRHLDLNNLTYQVQLTELSSSKKWLDHNLQQNTQVICYPAGRANQQTIKADRTLTANEAVYALKHRRIPQKKIVWITLDDSYKDNMTAAWPILKQTHQHATINFITGFTHKKNHLTLADAKRMQASGNI